MKRIRVLIVDDSSLVADGLREILQAEGDIAVVGHASNGEQAATLVEELSPDLVTMDIRMPVMDGLEAIEEIMAFAPTPILVITGEQGGDRLTFEALERGALDLVHKPEVLPREGEGHKALRRKVRLLAGVPVIQHVAGRRRKRAAKRHDETAEARRDPERQIIAVCSSTGGPHALPRLLGPLPANFPVSIVVVQHITDGFGEGFARWLNDEIPLEVRIPKSGDPVEPGKVLLAPDGKHMRVSPAGRVHLEAAAPIDGHLPSGNALLESVAAVYGPRSVGVILTGMQSDGARGLLAIRNAGGVTFAQDEGTSIVYGMPKAAIQMGAAERELPLHDMPRALALAIGLPGLVPSSTQLPAISDDSLPQPRIP